MVYKFEVPYVFLSGAVCSRSSPEGGRLGEEVVQQRTPPAVAVLGGIPAAPQNVAGPPQHVLQPVPAASLPPQLLGPATEMEQQRANTQAANQEHTTTMAWQNCNTKEPKEKSTLHCSTEAVQQQTVSMATGNSQNLSDRLSACDTGNVRKGQDLHYEYNTEKTSLEQKETEMAEGTGHCQDRTPDPGVAVKLEKGPLAPEKASLECKSKTGNEELRETKHTARQSTYISTIQSSSAVSTSHKATDRDHKQSGDTEQFRTASSLHSAQGSLLLESDAHKIAQQPLESTSITANAEILNESSNGSYSMDEVTNESLAANKEGGVGSSSAASEKECHYSEAEGFPAKHEETVSGLPVPTGNGNGTPNNTDENAPTDGCISKSLQESSVIAVSTPNTALSQKTPNPSNRSQTANVTQANQLSPDCVNCSGTPKSVLIGNKTGETGRQETKAVSVSETGVCYDISVKEPKVLGDETCTHNIQAPEVTEGSHVVASKQNDCAKSMQISPYQDLQPDGSYLLLHKNKCTNLEGLDSNAPCLSQVKNDCLIQQGQESILVDHKLPQMECLDDGISTSANINVNEKHDGGSEAFSGLNTVEMKDLIDVGILMQPGMEDTWLVVSDHSPLIDGQCQSTEDTEMIDVSTEVMGHCPESQTSVAVYECTVPCFPPDAIPEAADLQLPEKVTADKHSFDSLTETLTQDFEPLSSHPATVLASQNVLASSASLTSSANVCIQNIVSEPTFCSSSENTINVLDSALINSTSVVQEEQVKSTENKLDVSQISLSSSVIDPKLLILKRGEALLKQPPRLALVTRNQSSSGTPCDCLDRESVECLSEYDLTTDVVAEKATKAPVSFHVLNAPCNVTGSSTKVESEKQALINSEHCVTFEKQIPQVEPLLNPDTSTPTLTQNSARLPSWPGNMCSTITDQSEGLANQPCQDTVLLKVEEQHLPVHDLAEIKDTQDNTMEQLDACIGESSEGEGDVSLEAQTNESIVIPSPAQNKVRKGPLGVHYALFFI